MVLMSDASAARSFASRRGLGKQRHVETRWLWLQAEVAQGTVVVKQVGTEQNPADVLTKYLGDAVMGGKLAQLGVRLSAIGPAGRGRGGVSKDIPGRGAICKCQV